MIIKEAEVEKKNGISTILETTITDLGLTKGQDGDKITSLEKSITKLTMRKVLSLSQAQQTR